MESRGRAFLLDPPRFALGIACLSLLLPSPAASAQSPAATGSSGEERFRLLYRGEPAGEESFTIAEEAGGVVRVTAQASVRLPGRAHSMTQELEVDAATLGLRTYELAVQTGEEVQTVRARRSADSLVVEVKAARGQFRRATAEEGEVWVLDNLLVNHVALLARLLVRDPRESLRVVVPQVGTVLPAVVSMGPAAPDGRRRIALRIATVQEEATVDSAGGLLRLEVPSQGIVYERLGEDGAAAATPPSATVERESAQTARVPEGERVPVRRLYEERVRPFLAGGLRMDGLLTLPRGGQRIPYPAVLFLHDAGPLDRDGTVGESRPFRDLARGLAVFGVASMRYDKRTLAAPQTFDPLRDTVEREVIADALAALEAMRSETEIDGDALALVGHGLGGSLAGAIARRSGRVAGIVVLAGSARPLDALMREQIEGLDSQSAARLLAQIDSLAAGALPETRLVLGTSGAYLRDYRSRDLAAEILAFPGPVLFLQGGKDQRVKTRDFDLWKERMEAGGKRNVEFRLFPELDHLFIPVSSGSATEGVDPEVMAEIARFVRALR